jgi:pimeloyl-ACP methyl ester carboxylesterase
MRPTIVLVHGAFAESASWNRVIESLNGSGHDVIAAANPLRHLAADAESVSDLLRTIGGPIVLVAHSYGGAVISNVAADSGDIAGLVYANGFAPESGENCFGLAARFPGSRLGESTVRPVPRHDGTTDFYIAAHSFHDVFCQDVSAPEATLRSAPRPRRRSSSRQASSRSGGTCRRGS